MGWLMEMWWLMENDVVNQEKWWLMEIGEVVAHGDVVAFGVVVAHGDVVALGDVVAHGDGWFMEKLEMR